MRRLSGRHRKSASDDLALMGFHPDEVGAGPTTVRAYLDRLRAACRRISDAPEGGRARDALLPDLRMGTFERPVAITSMIDEIGVRIVNVSARGRDIDGFNARISIRTA